MGGGDWANTLYARREHARREREFYQREANSNKPVAQPQVPDPQPATYSGPRPTRFDRILDNEEVPSVSSKPSTPLLGSTRFDRILREDED
jgi:hypothetical protein